MRQVIRLLLELTRWKYMHAHTYKRNFKPNYFIELISICSYPSILYSIFVLLSMKACFKVKRFL